MNRIKEFRQKKGISRKELADKLDADVPTVWQWEAHGRKPNSYFLKEMAQIFDCEIHELLEQPNEIKKPTKILASQLQLLSYICRSNTCIPDEIAQLTEQMINICDRLQDCAC